jgi:hypothetical protein
MYLHFVCLCSVVYTFNYKVRQLRRKKSIYYLTFKNPRTYCEYMDERTPPNAHKHTTGTSVQADRPAQGYRNITTQKFNTKLPTLDTLKPKVIYTVNKRSVPTSRRTH